jgi:type I restriction enzyme S subunit
VAIIARGGSPRPIKSYLTDDILGINWIKIGDTEKGEKYIYSTSEKIDSSGIAKTRLVKSGDFLLSNSMSFGRPYILKIDGAIHDGWLMISDFQSFYSSDFLYWLLSSEVINRQFRDAASGTAVKNLNSDKVAQTIVPILNLKEQIKISRKIDTVNKLIESVKREAYQ